MRAIEIQEHGGPDVLDLCEIDEPTPGDDQVVVRLAAIGVNFIDVYHRTGAYDVALPFVPGVEGAGVIEAVGSGVNGFRTGDRVAWTMSPGGYAEFAAVPATRVVALPSDISFDQAASVMLQGLTAHYLATDTFPLAEGDTALVYAAAGGVGHLLTQLADRAGARVIATASTADKAELARADGADEVVLYRDEDLEQRVLEMTDGRGVDVVYDSVGRDTFDASLKVLRQRGTAVLYGQSSGPVAPLDLQVLNQRGSLFVTRPSLAHYIDDREELNRRAADIFGLLEDGGLHARIDRTFHLDEAADAHRWLERGATTGKLLLLP